jgi:hypothetical protein
MKRADSTAAPSLTRPRCAGEGTRAIGVLDEGHALRPLPQSGGGLSRGRGRP